MTLVYEGTFPTRLAATRFLLEHVASWARDGELNIEHRDAGAQGVILRVERLERATRAKDNA